MSTTFSLVVYVKPPHARPNRPSTTRIIPSVLFTATSFGRCSPVEPGLSTSPTPSQFAPSTLRATLPAMGSSRESPTTGHCVTKSGRAVPELAWLSEIGHHKPAISRIAQQIHGSLLALHYWLLLTKYGRSMPRVT